MNAHKAAKVTFAVRHVLAENVRELMDLRYAKHGDRVKVLAAKSGVSRSTIQRLLNAEYATTVDTIETMARALGVPAFQLLVKVHRAG